MSRRLMLRNESGGSTPILPSEYQQVEWIQNPVNSSATGAYFETTPRLPKKFKFNMRCFKGEKPGGYSSVACGYRSGSSNFTLFAYSTTDNLVFSQPKNATSAYVVVTDLYSEPIDVEIVVDNDNLSIGLTVSNSNGDFSSSGTMASDYTFYDKPLRVFWLGLTATQFMKGRIYHLSVENTETNAKVLDLYPCYRKSDDVVGMYDTANDKFYPSSTAVAFTKGADV